MQVKQVTWEAGSAVQQAEIRKLESGSYEALLYAPEDSQRGDLSSVPLHLTQKGFSAVADTIDGVNVLRVSGIKKEEDILGALTESGFIKGTGKEELVGEKDNVSFVEKIRKSTVRLNGMFGIVGHAGMAVAGALEGDMRRVGTAAFYTMSTSTSALYGAGKPGAEFDKVIDGMRGYLSQQGVEIPKDEKLTAAELAKKGGVIEKLHEFVQQHPIEVGNTIGLMGNLMFMYSGINESRKSNDGTNVGIARTASGLASVIGALSVILIQEKQRGAKKSEWPGLENVDGIAAPQKSPEQLAEADSSRSLPRKFADFVQEKPMRFAGLLNIAGNVAMFKDVSQIKAKHKNVLGELEQRMAAADASGVAHGLEKDYAKAKRASMSGHFSMATACAYLVATTFGTLSSKAKPADYTEQETVSKLTAMSAEMLAHQPAEVRDLAIDKMATYLAKEEKVTQSREELITLINEKVETLGKSPWLAKVSTERAAAAQAAGQQTGAHI
ncbi:MAG: hypothetical protein FJX23_00820 [Alphaproteobacteria bacterium]|nr:hypothetical protein [Alphaproteobacteria bacterium]